MTIYDGIMLPKVSEGIFKSVYHFVAGKESVDDVKQRERVRGFVAMLPQFNDSVSSVASASKALTRIDQAVTRQVDLLSSLSSKDCSSVVNSLGDVSKYTLIHTNSSPCIISAPSNFYHMLPGIERLRHAGWTHTLRESWSDDRPSSGVHNSSADTRYQSEENPLQPRLHLHPQLPLHPQLHKF